MERTILPLLPWKNMLPLLLWYKIYSPCCYGKKYNLVALVRNILLLLLWKETGLGLIPFNKNNSNYFLKKNPNFNSHSGKNRNSILKTFQENKSKSNSNSF